MLHWWEGFNDPVLNLLLQSAEAGHPTLSRALAAIASARASRQQAASGAYPQANAGAGVTRRGTHLPGEADNNASSVAASQPAASTSRNAGFDASWEIDLFGAVRRSTEAATARVDAREAEWHDARISLAAEVGSEYVGYRACQLLAQSQRANLESLRTTEQGTRAGADTGLMPPADLTLASAAVANAQASLGAQEAECELSVKSLVALTGVDEPALRLTLASCSGLPELAALEVTALPVRLLSQRPDVVAAERGLAAASADIGVAEASRYPRLSLLGSISVTRVESSGTGGTTVPWSFGPSLSLPLFDGGRRHAQVASAAAGYDIALANYRQAVRTAVKDVEQSLVRLDAAAQRSAAVASAARDYRRYFDNAAENWSVGGISLLALEEARRSAFIAEQNDIALRRDRVLYGIALYKSLGGGWQGMDNMNVTGVSQ